jgi:hypothetical protein
MTSRQCEIAAESYSACLLAQAGYDILIQYGANQPYYDIVANKDERFLPISVKGSQDGGWMLSVKYKNENNSYHEAIDNWLNAQRNDVIFLFVQFINIRIGESPRTYIALPNEIAAHMKTQCNGRGHGSLQEDYRRDHPGSRYNHKIPTDWLFTQNRIDRMGL